MDTWKRKANLERKVVLFAYISRQFYDGLHSQDLSLDIHIEVLLFYFGETQEMDGPNVAGFRILRDEGLERLIQVLRHKRRIR